VETQNKVIPLGDPSLKKESVIFTVEPAVKELIDNIVHRGESYVMRSKNGDKEVEFKEQYPDYPDVPRTIGGVVLHYFLKGVEEDMGIEFDQKPYALRERASGSSGKGTGERFSKEKKNDILARCDASFYDPSLGMDTIFENIKSAMEEKKYWEDQGYVLTPEKTKPPMKKDSEKYMEYLEAKTATKAAAQKRGAALGAMAKQTGKNA
jgi:hypothetical protein